MRRPVVLLLGSITAAVGLALQGGAVVGCGAAVHPHDTDEAIASSCATCHGGAYTAAVSPKHLGVFPQTCEDCHKLTAWAPVPSFHDLAAVQAKECVACHRDVYDATSRPKHAPLFPAECKDCHGTEKWAPLPRDIHESETAKRTECFPCHETQYKEAANPKHEGVLPTTCKTCHGTTAWKPSVTAPPGP